MENESEIEEYHSTLEPDVIIEDQSGGELFETCSKTTDEAKEIFDRIVPDVSLIPVTRSAIKFRTYGRTSTFSQTGEAIQETKVQRLISRSPRQTVRLISKEEIAQAENGNSNSKRNSLPLQKCPICKKFFRRMKTHLQKHEAVQRDPNDKLTCRYCMKVFNTGSNLSIHMRTHTGDKPYRCEICSKGFAQSCNLVNHMRIHTGERPYRCPHCERAFTQSGNLSNHIRLHTDEKPFQCHFCDKAFTQSGNLNSHIRNNHKFLESEGSHDASGKIQQPV